LWIGSLPLHTRCDKFISPLYVYCSNSPFWYCDAGMNYVIGEGWRDQWDVVIASAGKSCLFKYMSVFTPKARQFDYSI